MDRCICVWERGTLFSSRIIDPISSRTAENLRFHKRYYIIESRKKSPRRSPRSQMHGPPNCETVRKWWFLVSGLFFNEFWVCWGVSTLTPYLEVHQYRGASSAQLHSACLREVARVWLLSYHTVSRVAAVFRFIYDANAYMRRVLKQFWQNVDHIWNIRFSDLNQFACCHPHFETWPNPNPL